MARPASGDPLVHTSAETVRTRVGRWAQVEEVDADSCLMVMETDTLDWPAMSLASLGAEFEIREPGELRAHVHEIAERFGRAAGGA